jgi:hypothetical protein
LVENVPVPELAIARKINRSSEESAYGHPDEAQLIASINLSLRSLQ